MSATAAVTHLPVEPLVEAVESARAAHLSICADGSMRARSLWPDNGAVGRAYYRALRAGALTVDAADRLAVAVGKHPCEVWGQLWWSAVESADDEKPEG